MKSVVDELLNSAKVRGVGVDNTKNLLKRVGFPKMFLKLFEMGIKSFECTVEFNRITSVHSVHVYFR